MGISSFYSWSPRFSTIHMKKVMVHFSFCLLDFNFPFKKLTFLIKKRLLIEWFINHWLSVSEPCGKVFLSITRYLSNQGELESEKEKTKILSFQKATRLVFYIVLVTEISLNLECSFSSKSALSSFCSASIGFFQMGMPCIKSWKWVSNRCYVL